MNILIRKACKNDINSIVSLLKDDELGGVREELGHPNYLLAFNKINNDPQQLLIVCELDNLIIGTAQLTLIPYINRKGITRGLIEGVRVHSSYRGKGIGKEMFKWLINESRQRGCKIVQLTTDKSRIEALKFYKSLGFIDTHIGMKLEFNSTYNNSICWV
jgi:ribosomal protein S18 acetylase RimI-like enzyme